MDAMICHCKRRGLLQVSWNREFEAIFEVYPKQANSSCELWMMIITRDSDVTMFSPCVFFYVCVFMCMCVFLQG